MDEDEILNLNESVSEGFPSYFSILNGCGDIFDEKIWRERKKNKYKEEQIGEGPFSITTCRCEPVYEI